MATPTQIVGQVLKRLYPQNPDIVLGREARIIVEAIEAAGLTLVTTEDYERIQEALA